MVEINEAQITHLLRGLEIPPCPAVLAGLSEEMQLEHVDVSRIAGLISRDVALAGGVLKIANSPLFSTGTKITSVNQALAILGFKNVFNMVINELLRKTLITSELPLRMDRFWDSAAYNARVSAELADVVAGTSRDTAYSFGLFHDCGMPILMRRFADYKETLMLANVTGSGSFTDCEDQRHGSNHAVIGYLMARNWGLPESMAQAVLVHHDYSIFANDSHLPDETLALVAINFIAERITSLHLRSADDFDWLRGKDRVGLFVGLNGSELDDLVDDLLYRLDSAGDGQRNDNFA